MGLPRRPPRPRARTAPARRSRARRRPGARSSLGPRRLGLTSRAAVFGAVVCVLLLSFAYPLREFVAQRQEIGDLRAQIRDSRQRIAALRDERARWDDPAYARAQARTRLHYVMPGETAYVVLGGPSAPQGADPLSAIPVPTMVVQSRSWYSTLWQSVQEAGGT